MRYLATISYDGSNYYGFQRLKDNITVQGELEKAFKNMLTHKVSIHSSGRTDRGVHALAQTFHFDSDVSLDTNIWTQALNLRLPDDISIEKIEIVSNTFHARHHAKIRTYIYRIAKKESNVFTQRYEVYYDNFNITKIISHLDKFIGLKDFTGFSKLDKGKDPIREVLDFTVIEDETHYIFEIKAKSFLRYMVRSIIGTLIDIATDKLDANIIDKIFKTKNRRLAGTTAPAKALFFKSVTY